MDRGKAAGGAARSADLASDGKGRRCAVSVSGQ